MTRGLGLGVVGCGVIGANRARLAAAHAAVGRVFVCDLIAAKARQVAEQIGAADWATDFRSVVTSPDLAAVVVASSEGNHFAPAMTAIEAGKHVLIEKPFVLDLDEARRLVEAAEANNVELVVGYTQRFRRRYASAKQQVLEGKLGAITSGFGKIYITKGVAEAVVGRAQKTTASVNTLTYLADLMLWYLEGRRPISVYAAGGKGAFWDQNGVLDSNWAIIRFEGGTVVTIGVSWELPGFHPAFVATMEVELFGRKGTLQIDDAHRDFLLVSEQETPSPYNPAYSSRVAQLGSAMPGDWAMGSLYGPMSEETNAFIDLAAGLRHDAVLAGGRHAFNVLALTLAIDESARRGQIVDLTEPAWSLKAAAMA
jgi:myo-inositol 2-dehydrogenase/D-chiro-inositol 1-dehydrogenase